MKRIVLFFTPESALSEEDAELMNRIPGARQRNAALIDPEGPLEKCDAVAGPAIPENYSHLPLAKALAAEDTEEEEAEDEAADFDSMSVAQLKAALDEANVEYPATAKKAALVALCNEHLTGEE